MWETLGITSPLPVVNGKRAAVCQGIGLGGFPPTAPQRDRGNPCKEQSIWGTPQSEAEWSPTGGELCRVLGRVLGGTAEPARYSMSLLD